MFHATHEIFKKDNTLTSCELPIFSFPLFSLGKQRQQHGVHLLWGSWEIDVSWKVPWTLTSGGQEEGCGVAMPSCVANYHLTP